MNSTRLAYAVVAIGAFAILVLAACGASGPKAGSAEALYIDLGCAKCHGDDREGQRSGPPLIKIIDHWNEESLLRYLRDTKPFVASNPRLSYLDEQYPIAMPVSIHPLNRHPRLGHRQLGEPARGRINLIKIGKRTHETRYTSGTGSKTKRMVASDRNGGQG